MNTKMIAGAALALVLATPVSAADLSYPAPVAYAPAPIFTWTGFYAGLNAGYGWADADFSNGDVDGFVGGGQVGFNWQTESPLVLGIEADLQYSGVDGGAFSLDYFGTARLRAGYAFNQALVYGTGGLAYGRGEYELGGLSNDQNHVGWTLGGGLEYAIDRNWSAKAEYLYVDLGSEDYLTVQGNRSVDVTANILRAGVNYRF